MSEDRAKGLWWLASYPKSGNTWARAFLANLLSGQPDSVSINVLNIGANAGSRVLVEDAIGYDVSELNHEEITALRPIAFRWFAQQVDAGYHKIHDAFSQLPDGQSIIPLDVTRGVVCIVRNPLDVVASYANHSGISIDEAVGAICNPDYGYFYFTDRQAAQLPQRLGTWSDHVESWLDAEVNKIVIRYENLKRDPVGEFSRMTHFLDLDQGVDQLTAAVENCRFERLRKQEDDAGFVEKPSGMKNFFRRGRTGGWREELSDDHVKRVIEVNRSGMIRLGYLNAAGELAGDLKN